MFLFILVLFGSFAYMSKDSDTDLYKLTFERFEKASEGDTNRTDDRMKSAKKTFQNSPLFGVGLTRMKLAGAGDNPYESLACDGIVGSVILYLPLLMILRLKKRKELAYAVIILSIGYLQRPLHPQVIHFFMLYSFLALCCYEKRKHPQSISNNNML